MKASALEKIPLYCAYTPAHHSLFHDWFLPSVPRDFDLHACELPIAGPGDYLSPEFLDCIRRKHQLIRDSISRHPGREIIWSDVDIIFLPAFSTRELVEELRNSRFSILYQRENPDTAELNTGFMICRCSEAVLSFMEEVIAAMAAHPSWNEQKAVNELLQRGSGKDLIGSLPLSYYARTHGWPPDPHPKIYHANGTSGPDGVRRKIRQLQTFRAYERGSPLARFLITTAKTALAAIRSKGSG